MFGFRKYDFDKNEIPPYKPTVAFSYAMVAVMFAYVVAFVITAITKSDDSNLLVYASGFFLVSLALFIGSLLSMKVNFLTMRDVTGFKFSPKFIAVIALVLFGTIFGFGKLNDYFVAFLEGFGYKPSSITLPEKSVLSVIVCVVFIAIIPAITEEFLFRGLLLNASRYFGDVFAVIISALAFSLYHMSPAQTIYQFVIGVVYGFIALGSQSVLPTTVLHFLNNFVIITINYLFPSFLVSGTVEIILTIAGVVAVFLGLFIALKGFDFKKSEKRKGIEKIGYLMLVSPGFLICLIVWVAQLFV